MWPGAVWAWHSPGHQSVGQLADNLIPESSTAKKQIRAILASGETLRDATVWADCAKSIQPRRAFEYLPDERYRDTACALYETPEGKAEMAAFVRRNNDNCLYAGRRENCHKSFHFTNIPLQEGRYAAKAVGTADADIVQTLNAAIAVLKGEAAPPPFGIPASAEGKREALRLIAHLVGDLHQPLHVGAVYLSAEGVPLAPDNAAVGSTSNTIGGNALVIGEGAELHSDWDHISDALAVENLTGEAATITRTSGPVSKWAETWASETVLAAQQAYSGIRYGKLRQGNRPGSSVWPIEFKDRTAYVAAQQAQQRQQIVKAGARFAELLLAIWR